MVVRVKDMPLGKLLRLLALTSHTSYVSKNAESGAANARTYRISRRSQQEKELASLLQASRDTKLAIADWYWDALVKLGSSAESAGGSTESRLIGKILGSLDADAKKKALDGKEIVIRASAYLHY